MSRAAVKLISLIPLQVVFAQRLNCPVIGPNITFRPIFTLKPPRTIFASWYGFLSCPQVQHPSSFSSSSNVTEFCPDADCSSSFVHRREPGDKVAKSLTNYKSAIHNYQLVHPYSIHGIAYLAVMSVIHLMRASAIWAEAPVL